MRTETIERAQTLASGFVKISATGPAILSRFAILACVCFCAAISSARADDKGECKTSQTAPAQRISACTRLIDARPPAGIDLMMTYANRAAAKRNAGDIAGAIADFDAGLAVEKSGAARGYDDTTKIVAPSLRDNVLRLRGDAKVAAGDHRGALADFNAGLAQAPLSISTRLARASVLVKLGRNADAVADYRAVLATEPAFLPATMKARAEDGLKSLGAKP